MKTHIIFACILLASCKGDPQAPAETIKIRNNASQAIEVLTVDSCEYVVVSGTYATAIVHKQNCKNH